MEKDGWYYSKKQITIGSLENVDKFTELESISVNSYDDKLKVDLSPFRNLIMLHGDYKKMINLKRVTTLNYLYLINYTDRDREIANLNNLIEFADSMGKYKDLGFLRSKNLHLISLLGNSKLTDISGIKNHPTLKELDIESCKNIPVDHLVEVVISLKKLEVLKLHNFEFEDIAWVKQLPNLKDLVITRSNVIDGDISPAAHLEYVAIDNRKHYNYRFDSTTRTMHPVRPKGVYVPKDPNEGSDKHKRSEVQIPHFGDFDAKSLDMDYETDMAFKDVRVNLELHFEEESIAKSKLNAVIKLLQSVEKDHDVIKDMLKNDFTQSGVVKEYFEYFIEEIENVTEVDFWKSLVLKRIAFYPHDEDDYGVYDFGIDEISPYVLSLKVDHKGKITGLEMES
jgi:hypothetical protein